MALQVTCVPYVGTLGTPICQPPRHLVRYASSLYSRSHQSSLKPQATAYGLSTNIGQSGWSSHLPNHLRTLAVRQLRSCLREKWKRPGRSLCLSILTNLLSIPLVLVHITIITITIDIRFTAHPNRINNITIRWRNIIFINIHTLSFIT